jgi:hypothetical protein
VSLREISQFVVPSEILRYTDEALREAGSEHMERFVLWAGVEEQRTFQVRSSHVPEQTAYRMDHGLLVEVEGPALHRLNVWLHEHGEVLGVQVHAHPGEAYHSQTDDTYPIVTELGALSIVAPEFCDRGLRGSGVTVYRLTRNGWIEVRGRGLARLLVFA